MRLVLLCLLTMLAACGQNGRDLASSLGPDAGFQEGRFTTPSFVLYGLLRPGTTDTLHVYIEGDGFAWSSRTRPSPDPTPKNPVSLYLAVHDPSPAAVLYLARPCQYVLGADRRMCSVKYWTSGRYAPEVVESLDRAIDQAKERVQARKVVLVGYSGGGGVAALLAARRKDVVFLGTVAGNVDHESWTRYHAVGPLRDSLNPLDVAPQLRGLAQRHMSSQADSVVPPLISENFCRKLENPEACVVLRNVEHNGHWETVWNYSYK